MKAQSWIFLLATLLLTACADDGGTKEVTSEEKAVTYLEMGVRYMEMGELKTAKESLEKALDWDSSNAEIQNAAAAMYEKIKEPEKAREHYEKSLRLDADNPQIRNNYGRFLCEQGEVNEGLEHLKTALNMPLNNRRWFALTNTGRCLLKMGKKNEAENHFRDALQLQSDYPPALLEMAKINFAEGNHLHAKAFLQRYETTAPPTPESLWYAIEIESGLQHKAQAEQYKKALLNMFPLSDEAKRMKTAIMD
jgi:type IV pilus assembly protein PilF